MIENGQWWWLSFCDPDRPKGQKFVGVALVQAHSASEALTAARILGCNPGGEVMTVPVPVEDGAPPRGYTNRLLNVNEMRTMQALWTPDSPGVTTLGEAAAKGSPIAQRMIDKDEGS